MSRVHLVINDKLLGALLLVASLLQITIAHSQGIAEGIVGRWIVNVELSEDTDDRVAEAIVKGGGRDSRGLFNRKKDFYRGGPPDQELYDRISYDNVLTIAYSEPELRFTYADDYTRVFHTDGRRRRTTANDFYTAGGLDWSFGNWEGESLVVEARPRDNGFTLETYKLEANGRRLRVEMLIQPGSFGEPVNLVRVYDRQD